MEAISQLRFPLPRRIKLTTKIRYHSIIGFVSGDGIDAAAISDGVSIDVSYVGIIFMTRVLLVPVFVVVLMFLVFIVVLPVVFIIEVGEGRGRGALCQ